MENGNFIENIATRIGQNATVKNVFGDPVTANDKTIIPVAQVAFGFGGGFGKGIKNKNQTLDYSDENKTGKNEGEGGGGGGGLRATALGVYEVSNQGTRFIPATNNKQLLIAALVGFLVRGWLIRKKRNK